MPPPTPYSPSSEFPQIALNEQFMVADLDQPKETATSPNGTKVPKKQQSLPTESTNFVLRILREKLGESKTFGENIIFILNRLSRLSADIDSFFRS